MGSLREHHTQGVTFGAMIGLVGRAEDIRVLPTLNVAETEGD